MSTPVATVIVPTFDHGATIELTVASALRQTMPVEVLIIGDGVPDSHKVYMEQLVRSDARVRFLDHPKDPRRGEPYRHEALTQARGHIVCYLCDRDLWFPTHVERLATMLETADFAHSLPMHLHPGGLWQFFPVDLAHPVHRQLMLTHWNRVPLSCAAHTLSAYQRLPEGWSPTPAGTATDWHMFRKFLLDPQCRCASGAVPTALTFPSPPRKGWTMAQRVEELQGWKALIDNTATNTALMMRFMELAIQARDRELAGYYGEQFFPAAPP